MKRRMGRGRGDTQDGITVIVIPSFFFLFLLHSTIWQFLLASTYCTKKGRTRIGTCDKEKEANCLWHIPAMTLAFPVVTCHARGILGEGHLPRLSALHNLPFFVDRGSGNVLVLEMVLNICTVVGVWGSRWEKKDLGCKEKRVCTVAGQNWHSFSVRPYAKHQVVECSSLVVLRLA